MEKWKRIVIQDKETNYEVSNFGRCRNITRLNSKNKGIIKPKINGKTGYCQYSFSINGDKHYRYAHRLVAEYFLPKPKDGQDEVNHKDGNKENNHHTNLDQHRYPRIILKFQLPLPLPKVRHLKNLHQRQH